MAETASSIALDLQDLRDELLNRVARFLVMEAPTHQIAIATGLTEEKVSKLADTQLVKDKMASLQSEQLDQADKLRRGWDAVEEEALGTVLHTLQANPDPDYALRAAAVANKAERRNGDRKSVV